MTSNGSINGAGLIGAFIALVLYGISVMQTFIYFVRYYTDKVYLKLLVAVVFLLDTIHKCFLCAGIWRSLIQDFGNYSALNALNKTDFIVPMTTIIISTLMQLFFIYRIWFLSSGYFKPIFPMVVLPFIIAQPFMVIYYTIRTWNMTELQDLSRDITLVVLGGEINGAAAAIDVIIALTMCTLLAQGRTRINANTDRILVRLIIVSINTGLWTAILSAITVILIIVLGQELVYLGTYYPLSTLYCNTLLANLNVRAYVQSVDDYEVYNIPSIHIATQSRTINREGEEIVFGNMGVKIVDA